MLGTQIRKTETIQKETTKNKGKKSTKLFFKVKLHVKEQQQKQ